MLSFPAPNEKCAVQNSPNVFYRSKLPKRFLAGDFLLGGFYSVLQSNLKINLRKFCSQCFLQFGSCMYILPRTKNVLYRIRQMYSTLLGGFYFVLQPNLKINLRKFCSQCFLQFGSCMYILPRTKNVLWAKLAKFRHGPPFRRTYPFLL